MLVVSVTCKNRGEAARIARVVVSKRLAACANFFPVKSCYWWEGKQERAAEYLLIVKTLPSRFGAVAREIAALHSYRLPVIHAHRERTTKAAGRWLREELR